MNNLERIQKEIVEEFSLMPDWFDKYNYIIELAQTLPLIDESHRTAEHLIEGCQSRVWIDAECRDGRLYFTADSDAVITKGIIALLVRVFNGALPSEILNTGIEFLDEIGLRENLSPHRANGLLSMVNRIKLYAKAYESAADIKC